MAIRQTAVWQTAPGKRSSARCRLADGIWHTASVVCQMPSGRRQTPCLPDSFWHKASARHHLADGRCRVCQTDSGRRRLPDAASTRRLSGRRPRVWQTVLCQTPSGRLSARCGIWQMCVHLSDVASGRQCLPSARLPRVCQMASGRWPAGRNRLADGVWQTRRLLSARWRLADAFCQKPSCRRRLNWSEYEGKAWEQGYLRPDTHRFTYTLLLIFRPKCTKSEVSVRVQTCR